MQTRRRFLAASAGTVFLSGLTDIFAAENKSPWKLGICDWDLRAMGRMNSFDVAKELGFDGVQVSYQPSGPDSLAVKDNRPKFLDEAKKTGVGIASLAMGLLNGQPLATTPDAEGWVADCIDAMVEMNVEQVLLAFFAKGDMNEKKEDQPLVVEKLKRLAEVAEEKKKILSLESYLSAEDSLRIVDAVGSDAVKIYYDVRNSRNKGYDIFTEMKMLAQRKMISQIHLKEDGKRLGTGDIDFVKVRKTLEEIDYRGWLVVEGGVSGDWKESQTANAVFVRKTFGM